MKHIFIILILATSFSCNKSEQNEFMYNQLVNYRNDLKSLNQSQRDFYFQETRKNDLYKKIFDSVNKINIEFEKSFERLRYGDEETLLRFRDEFNSKCNLNLEFDSYSNIENIPDSVFNRLIEVDILRLQKRFIENYMNIKGCK